MAVIEHSSLHHSAGGLFTLAGLTTTLSVASSIASLGMLALVVAPMFGLVIPFGLTAAACAPFILVLGIFNTAAQLAGKFLKTGQVGNADLLMSFGPLAAVAGMSAVGLGEQRWWLTLGLSLVGLVGAVKNKGYLSGTASAGWFALALANILGVTSQPLMTTASADHPTAKPTEAAIAVKETFAKLHNEYQCGTVVLASVDKPIHSQQDLVALGAKHGITVNIDSAHAHEGKSLGSGLAGVAIAGQTQSGELAHVISVDTSTGIPKILAEHTIRHEYDHACFNQQQNVGFNSAGELTVPAGLTEWMREVHADLAGFIDLSPEERQFILAYKDANFGDVYDTAAVMRYAAEQIPAGLTMNDPQVQSFVYRLAFEAAHGVPAATASEVQWAPFDDQTPQGQFVTKFAPDPLSPIAASGNTIRISTTAPAP